MTAATASACQLLSNAEACQGMPWQLVLLVSMSSGSISRLARNEAVHNEAECEQYLAVTGKQRPLHLNSSDGMHCMSLSDILC